MGLLITFGKFHHALDFGIAIPMVEYGLRKYGEAWYENGILTTKNSHPIVKKLFDWLDDQSPNFTWRYDFTLDTLNLEELEFVYQLMCDFRNEGTSIDGETYDSPINEGQKRQLDEAIPVTKLYIDARQSGLEEQKKS